MKFIQTYSINEDINGVQSITTIVSDTFAGLFNTDDCFESDIIILEDFSKDISTKEDTFAVDEINFSINQLACETEIDENLLAFIIGSNNQNNKRYIAIYFGEVNNDNRLFIGKINNNISADDKVWFNDDYNTNINPKRIYKFKALSIDYKLLDKVLFTQPIRNAEGNIITISGIQLKNGIYSLINSPGYSTILNLIFDYRRTIKELYFYPLANLYKVLDLYLEIANLVLSNLESETIEYNLLESELDFKLSPVSYNFQDLGTNLGGIVNVFKNKRLKAKLSNTQNGADWSSLFIHRRMIDPALGNPIVENPSNSDEEFASELYYEELPFSFKNFNNLTELLVSIARDLGCYLKIDVTEEYKFNISFVNRKNVTEEGTTYIIGSSEAKIDSSFDFNKDEEKFISYANNLVSDGISTITYNAKSKEIETKNILSSQTLIKVNTNEKPKSFLLTTSVPIVQGDKYNNTIYWNNERIIPMNIIRKFVNSDGTQWLQEKHIERLHTGLYIATQVFEDEEIDLYGPDAIIFRPALQVYSKIGNKDEIFPFLNMYLYFIYNRDKSFYETTYDLTIPYWNSFSNSSDGANAKWSNLEIGSRILLEEEVITLEGSEFVSNYITKEYTVISIKINLQKPETKIKLHSNTRFQYDDWAGISEDIEDFTTNIIDNVPGGVEFAIENNSKPYVIEDDNEIAPGEVVARNSNNKIYKAINHTDFDSATGIALIGGTGGETIGVIEEGEIGFPFLTLTPGKVFLRKSSSSNISQTALNSKTSEEDKYVIIGNCLKENTLNINFKEYTFE